MDGQIDDTLDEKQQSIVSIAALTSKGDISRLAVALNAGLNAGQPVNKIKEILVQLYAYCGFPRSINALNAFISVLEERRSKGVKDPEGSDASPVSDSDKYQAGKKTLETLTGKEEKTLAGVNAFAPVIDTFLKEHLFADIFGRDILDYKERELVTISALMSMAGVEPQLRGHMLIGIHVGITEKQLQQITEIIGKIIGSKEGDTGMQVLASAITSQG